MIINKLSTQELQDLIGVSILDRLKDILPSLPESGIENPNDVYEKAFLIKIFLSFQGQDSFLKKNFRMMLLNRLSDDEIKKLAELLELNSNLGFDRLVKDISNINWEHNEQTKRMIKYFNLPIDYLPEPKEELPNVETIKCHERPFKLLKDFQFKVFMNAMTILENPMKRFVIQMPTGSGKTRTAMEIVTSFLIKNPGKSVIWLAHSDELCEQAVECFKDVWMHVGTFDIDIVRAWGKNNLKVQKRSSFVVAGFPKINSILKKNMELIKRFANNNILVIVDEAHKAIARTYKKVIESLVINSSNVPHLIGLTATPGRSDVDSKETKKLIEFFFKDKIEIDSGSKTVFQYLRDKKILSHIENEPISGRRYELSASEKNYIETYFDFPEGFLKRVSDDDVRNLEIIKKLKKECELNKKILFFGTSIEHSKFICALLNFLGFKAEHIDGLTRIDRRRNIIKNFKERSNNLNIICNYGVLTTGFDAPMIDVVFIARPTMSVVLYSQMVGRGLRGPAIGGTESCKLIDVKDNIDVYRSPDNVYDYFESYWKG